MKRLALLAVLLFVVPEAQSPQTLYVNPTVACTDGTGGGTEALPFCTLTRAAAVVQPGATVLVSGAKVQGPVEFTRSGTVDLPITYKAVGNVTIGVFTDLNDAAFVATAVPNVYSIPQAVSGYVWQTHFSDILVDDPDNASIYTMKSSDGPLQLAVAPDDATLAAQPGTYRFISGVLHVHPYGNAVPSATATDFVLGTGRSLNYASSVRYTVLDGFNISYSGSIYSAQVLGSYNTIRNVKYQGVSLWFRGSGNVAENVSVTHVHGRDASGSWLWHYRGIGIAVILGGWNHKLTDLHIFHNWNSDISTEIAYNTIIDGARIHGSPNHCGVGGGASASGGGNTIARNVVIYNCQDYLWSSDTNNLVYEHIVAAGDSIGLEAKDRALGPITVRNSILAGRFHYIRGLASRCTWEAGSLIENNVFGPGAEIERCADMKFYPLATYIANCDSGLWTGCATFRNNTIVPNWEAWKAVIKDGMWNAALGDSWNVELVPNSPALDKGASTTLTDLIGMPRPQGASADAGAYEVGVCVCPAFIRRPGTH